MWYAHISVECDLLFTAILCVCVVCMRLHLLRNRNLVFPIFSQHYPKYRKRKKNLWIAVFARKSIVWPLSFYPSLFLVISLSLYLILALSVSLSRFLSFRFSLSTWQFRCHCFTSFRSHAFFLRKEWFLWISVEINPFCLVIHSNHGLFDGTIIP